jgi:hypothetical protein
VFTTRCSTPSDAAKSRARSSSLGRYVSLLEVTAIIWSLGNDRAATARASDESTPPENATSALP